MSIRSQQAITLSFSTPLGSGASANATVGPVGTLLVNGVVNAASVSIAGVTTGTYSAAFTLPTLFVGDVVQLQVAATTNATAEKKIVWTDAVDLSLDDSGRVDVGKVNGNANAAAVFGALGALGFTGNSASPPTGKDFAFNDDLGNPAPTPYPGWLIFYVGESRRIETYSPGTLSGTTDLPFSSPMEGGNSVIVLPAYSPSVPTTAQTVAALAGTIPINVISPATPTHLDIVRGDSYISTEGVGRTLAFTYLGNEPWPSTISSATFTCKPTPETLNTYTNAASITDLACVVNVATGSGRKVTVNLSASNTATLQASLDGTNNYRWWINANGTNAGATLRMGTMTVRPNPSAT